MGFAALRPGIHRWNDVVRKKNHPELKGDHFEIC